MSTLFKKLNYKDQKTLHLLQAPGSFEKNREELPAETRIVRSLDETGPIAFVMVFVTKQSEIDSLVPEIATRLEGDAILWMCYPKTTSRKYRCDFNRDTGWQIMGPYGLEPVRMVAIDEDWSALRFRKATYIKKMTRSFGALSEEGKVKSGQSNKP